MSENPFLVHPATIVEKKQEATDIVSFRLRLNESKIRKRLSISGGTVQHALCLWCW